MGRCRRPRTGLGWIISLLALLATQAGAIQAPEPNGSAAHLPVEFWFVAANEGDSAGGHAALRIGPRVYHLEHRADGLIADRRTSPHRFERAYAGLGNRRIEAIPLALGPEARIRLEDALRTRFYTRSRDLARLDALEEEADFLAAALDRGRFEIEVPGLALFGPIHLPLGEAALRAFLAADAGRGSSPGGWTRRLRDAIALEVALESGARLRANTVVETPFRVGPHRAAWTRARAELEDQLQTLRTSTRHDRGLALLLARARAAVLDRSLATGRVHILAPFAGVAETQSNVERAPRLPPDWQAALEAEADARLSEALDALGTGSGPLEARLMELERAWHARSRTQAGTPATALETRSLSPSAARAFRARRVSIAWPEDVSRRTVGRLIESKRTEAARLRRTLERELNYNLLTRNCVTELLALLHEVDPALAPPSVLRGEFVPEIGAHRVASALGAGSLRVLPGTRERLLEDLRGETSSALDRFGLAVREAMAPMSRTYMPHNADSRFLLFADGPWIVRPIVGAVNLVYGAAGTTLGLLESPYDRGVGLRRGLQGMLMSVPELLFFQVRRGSYGVAPPESLAPRSSPNTTR